MGASGLSVGISRYEGDERMDPGDNGVYVIRGWEIVDRVCPYTPFEEEREYPLDAMLLEIDAAQPADQQLGDFLLAEEVPTASVEIGDVVYVQQIGGCYEPYPSPGSATGAL